MPANDRFITILKIHKVWADRFSIISIILAIGLMVTAVALGEMAQADAATRTDMMIVMGAVIIVVCIWQAAGMAAPHIHHHTLSRGLDVETR
jgi:hypothetical protein